MTPVLGIPCISRPDLLAACIASIDIPVRLAVIDNSPDGAMRAVTPEWAAYTKPLANLGVAASWNEIIRAYPDEPYWLIANADTAFGPGDLQALCEADPSLGWCGMNGDWRVFRLTRETVRRVGFFDAGGFPVCFCEDADYERRCDLAGVPWGFINGGATHVGSATLQDPAYAARNARTYPAHVAYYQAKWGTGVRAAGGYDTPFDAGGDVSEWTLDIDRLAELRW